MFFLEYFEADSRQRVISAVIVGLHCNGLGFMLLHPGLKTHYEDWCRHWPWGLDRPFPILWGLTSLSSTCVEWWFRGRISFIPRFLRPVSLDLSSVIHAECLSRPGVGAAAPTFHNKYLFKWPGVQTHFSFPRRLLTDDLKNCFPVTDRVIRYCSLFYSLPPGRWWELWLQVPQAASDGGKGLLGFGLFSSAPSGLLVASK